MIIRLLLAALIIGFIFWVKYRYQRLPEKEKRSWLLKILIYGFAGIMLAAVVTGKMHWFGAVIAGLLAVGKYGLRFLPLLKLFNVQKLFSNPVFKTPYLIVRLDIKAGTISGEILDGPHAGTAIEQLSPAMMEELENFYREKDARSHYLMKVLRQRLNANLHQQSQQRNHKQEDYSHLGDPSYDEAIQILGLEKLARERPVNREDIVKAHRQLIQKLHPDRGGNDYLAAQINRAKDVLTQKIR